MPPTWNLVDFKHQLLSDSAPERLTQRAGILIKAYRLEQRGLLEAYADMLQLEYSSETSLGKIFSQLIKRLHPDNYQRYRVQIESLDPSTDQHSLLAFVQLFGLPDYVDSHTKKIRLLEAGLDEEPIWYEPTSSESAPVDPLWDGEMEHYVDEHEADIYTSFSSIVQQEGWEGFPDDPLDAEEVSEWDEILFHSRGIETLNYLEYCQKAQQINLSDNHIEDISPLMFLHRVAFLDLSQNHIKDIFPLAPLLRLQELDCSSNQISQLDPLANMESLRWLNLSHNQIIDIAPLYALPTLAYLDLSYNMIRNLSVLLSIPQLRTVNLWGNPIPSNDLINQLRERNVRVYVKTRMVDQSRLSDANE